jgi:hypothetical protein
MKDQMTEWIMDPKTARKWAKGWLEDAKSGCHYPVIAIRQAHVSCKVKYNRDLIAKKRTSLPGGEQQWL